MVVGTHAGMFTDSTSVVSIHPPNHPGLLRFSLIKDSTPPPPLVCWSVFPPISDNSRSGIKAHGGVVGKRPPGDPTGLRVYPARPPGSRCHHGQ